MREIIFRGKRIDNDEWEQGSLFAEGSRVEIVRGTCNNVGIEGVDVIPETIGQYTGVTDKNGKKIFTNDIVAIVALGEDHNQKGAKTIAVVEDYMGNTCLCIDGKHQTGTTLYDITITHTVEVVGDTIDNPELLKGSG